MKILLINNYQNNNETATYDALRAGLAGHQVKTQRYRPGLKFEDYDRDLVILSGGGGEGSEINDKYKRDKLWYEDQINYILSTNKPILGICMGFEVIARAYNSKVLEMKDYITGFKKLTASQPRLQGQDNQKLRQYENHKWVVPAVSSKHFEVLAYSDSGIEMIKHKTRKITATQFHPEKGGTLNLTQLMLLSN
jgi:anthranilate/para-aminobenzoate synthase component II